MKVYKDCEFTWTFDDGETGEPDNGCCNLVFMDDKRIEIMFDFEEDTFRYSGSSDDGKNYHIFSLQNNKDNGSLTLSDDKTYLEGRFTGDGFSGVWLIELSDQ